jgi:hypothetical protein
MRFRKKTWFLTIEKIKCKLILRRRIYVFFKQIFISIAVECQLGQCEPQSVLILNYKNQLTAVHV